MNKQKAIDLSVGIFMVGGLLAFMVMVMKVSGITDLSSSHSYEVTADFSDIGGLRVRAPVTVAGVKVGEVVDITLQPEQLNAKVVMMLKDKPRIPYEDVSARILTEGLIGTNYVSIVPGFESAEDSKHPYLSEGDVIAKTQEAMILENLIGQLLFNIKK